MNLNELSQQVHAANINWWRDPHTGLPIQRNKGELLALIHSEISECADGEAGELNDDKLPHRKMAEVELVDAIIRALDYAGGFKYDLGKAALKFAVTEFENIISLRENAPEHPYGSTCWLLGIHSHVSRILELERKGKPDSEVAEALVLLILRIAEYAAEGGYDLQGAFEEKMAYNAKREDHKHAARMAAGGKKW